MVWLVFIVAVLNLCLGFALAVYCGPQLLGAAPLVAHAREHESTDVEEEEEPPEPIVLDEPEPEPAAEEEEAEPERDKCFIEATVDTFQDRISEYRSELYALDARLRECLAAPDAEAIERCRAELAKMNESYVGFQTESNDELKDERDGLGEMAYLGDNIELAVDEQSAQIETTNSNLERLDAAQEPGESALKLIGEVAKLLDSSHKLRDILNDAWLVVARHENRLGAIEKRHLTDELTGIPSRAALENMLWKWWKDDPYRSRQLSVALIDMDGFKRINEAHGPDVGDNVLQAIGEIVRTDLPDQAIAGRRAGQQFQMIIPDSGPRRAIKAVEQIRQMITAIEFRHREEKLDVTATCAIVGVEVDDESGAIFERVNQVLHDAKQQGRNLTLVHDGQKSEVAEPPGFALEKLQLDV